MEGEITMESMKYSNTVFPVPLDPRQVVSEGRITCLMVTHNMSQALTMGSRTLMMADGSIVLDVSGPERAAMTVDDLLRKFREGTGRALDNDRMLLSD